jgi:hypothetical protein
MKASSNQFGLLVAYLLPGFIGLAGVAPLTPLVALWLQPVSQGEAGFGPPIYTVLAATAVGMILNCFRWLLIDHIHHATGITPPVWDDSRLNERLTAFNYLVENHYRYYQFVGNTLVAVLLAYSINRWIGTSALWGMSTDIGILILCAALFAGSRDALSKYYTRTSRLIGQVAEKNSKGDIMYMHNGNDHKEENSAAEARPDLKAMPKPQLPPKSQQSKAVRTKK